MATDQAVANKRAHERLPVFAGNAEIRSVLGRGHKPKERGRILNWSRGGMLLKVKSPRRRFLVQKREPCLYEDDSLVCTLRLPPHYQDIFVNVDVVHVERDPQDPDHLHVGVKFDMENTPPEKLEQVAKVLEPKNRSGRLTAVSGTSKRMSARLEAQSRRSARTKRTSLRAAKVSKRVKSSESAAAEDEGLRTKSKSRRSSRRSARSSSKTSRRSSESSGRSERSSKREGSKSERSRRSSKSERTAKSERSSKSERTSKSSRSGKSSRKARRVTIKEHRTSSSGSSRRSRKSSRRSRRDA